MAAEAAAYATEDWQAQLEEVLALHAIFAKDFRVTHIPGASGASACGSPCSSPHAGGGSGSGGGGGSSHADLEQQLQALLGSEPPPPSAAGGLLLSCVALVDVELPCGQLRLVIDSGVDAAAARAGGAPLQDSSSTCGPAPHPEQQLVPFGPPVTHLPPVRVTLQLPRDYPSSAAAPPAVTLQAAWLSDAMRCQLEQQLQALWCEQGPGPVCFCWLDHIKCAALPALGVQQQLVLSTPARAPQQQQQQQRRRRLSREQCTGKQRPDDDGGSKQRQQQRLSPSAQPCTPPTATCEQQKQQQRRQAAPGDALHGMPSQSAAAQHSPSADSGAAAGGGCVEQLALALLRYSAAREQEDFNQATWTCRICFEEVPGAACLRLDCGHFYCSSCMASTARAQLQEGVVDAMRCPEPSCRRVVPPCVVKQLLGQEEFERWEQLQLSKALDGMQDVVYCPRCDTASVEDADHCAQCARCSFAWCTFCSDAWHPGRECLDAIERLRVLERRRRATSSADRHREVDLINQAMSLQWIKGASKPCPGCGISTIKSEGCNKMTCSNCRLQWCWKCCELVQGYEHFKEGACNLFDQAEIDRWHAMLWGNERAQEVEAGHRAMLMGRQRANAAQQRARLVRCPVCGQENLREGRNNLLRCWSCSSHFCVACGAWLRGKVGQHYIGSGACKQHGD